MPSANAIQMTAQKIEVDAGSVIHVDGISVNWKRERRRQEEDSFQIKESIQHTLHSEETNEETRNFGTRKTGDEN